MAIDFPASPTNGQKYPQPPVAGQPVYTWDGEKWKADQGGTAYIYASDTPPAGAVDNSLWFESDSGLLYFRFNDGTSTQWVILAPQPDASSYVRHDIAQTLTATQQVQARSNIGAAPYDAMAYSGMQINGGMEVSQENGAATVSGTSGGKYTVDGFKLFNIGTMATSAAQVTDAPLGFKNSLKITVTTAKASLASTDEVIVFQGIEGYRCARLAWGNIGAQSITISFWCKTHRTGMYSGSVINQAYNRSYAFTWTQNAVDTWEYKIVTIPGDVTGVWPTDNSGSGAIEFLIAGGTGVVTAPDVWTAGGKDGATGTTNGVAATSDTFQITGLTILPGTQAPTAAQSPNIMRPFPQEELICLRYYYKAAPSNDDFLGSQRGGGDSNTQIFFPQKMRTVPTITAAFSNAGAVTLVRSGFISCWLTTTGLSNYISSFVADARL